MYLFTESSRFPLNDTCTASASKNILKYVEDKLKYIETVAFGNSNTIFYHFSVPLQSDTILL